MSKTALIKNTVLPWTFKPSAAVTRARFVGDDGNQVATRGVKARAIADDSWTSDDITRNGNDLSGNYPGITGTLIGFDELEVDAAYSTTGLELTTDNQGRGSQAQPGEYVNAILFSSSTAAGDRVTALKLGNPYLKSQPFGSSTSNLPGQGNLSSQASVAGVGNAADTTDDVLFTYTMPASAFDQAGRGVTIAAFGKLAANGNNKRVKLWFGATVVADTGVVTGNNVGWSLTAEVFKAGAGGSNTQVAQGEAVVGATHQGAPVPVFPTETESGAIVIKVTGASGTTGAASDVLANFFEVNGMN